MEPANFAGLRIAPVFSMKTLPIGVHDFIFRGVSANWHRAITRRFAGRSFGFPPVPEVQTKTLSAEQTMVFSESSAV
jgi:hypothetical protein